MAKRRSETVDTNTGEVTPLPAGFKAVNVGFALAKDGDSITGVYRGPGAKKPMKGNKKPVQTYDVDTDGGTVNVLGAAQIDQFFASVKKGQSVFIKRTGTVKGGKGRVNTYQFAVK